MFQARMWGWKRIAARLLLLPVLAGGTATAAYAQVRTPGGTPASGTPASVMRPAGSNATKPADHKALLKEGRKALAAGQFDAAQDLARQAEASNPTGKWGLFDDTPNSLLQDVQEARSKAEKAQAEKLVKDAKALMSKPAANDAERAANLDQALQLARRADQLHGPYSAWDIGDRADKLVKEIEAVRPKVKAPLPLPTPPPSLAGNQPGANRPGTGQPFASTLPPARPTLTPPGTPTLNPPGTPALTPAGGVRPTNPMAGPTTPAAPATPAPDAKKAAAIKLMADAKVLADKGDFAGAKAKYQEADRCGANFGVNEPRPGFALQELNTRGAAAINRLIGEAQAQMGKKDYAKADAALNAAADVATSLGLFARPIDEAKNSLRAASGGKYGGAAPVAMAPAGVPDRVVSIPPKTGGPAPVRPTTGPAPVMPAGPVPVRPTGPAPVAPASPPASVNIAGPVTPLTPSGPAIPSGPTAVSPTGPAAVSPTAPVMAGPAAASPTAPVMAGPAPTNPTGNVTGRQLFDQAVIEFQKGDLKLAGELARQAYNQGMQKEATGLLNQIDAEAFKLKQVTAARSFEAAVGSMQNKDYGHALGVLVLIEPNLLPTDMRAKQQELITICKAEVDKGGGKQPGTVAAAGGAQPPTMPMGGDLQPTPMGTNPPGSARVGDPTTANPDNLANQVDAMKRVTFQKLRSEGLKVQADAQAAFGRGDTDVAIQMLLDYTNRVRAANLEPANVALLLRPIDSRLEMFRVMKGQADALAREKKDKTEAKALIAGRGAVDEQRKTEVVRLVRDYHGLVKQSKWADAERVALQAKQLEPDDPAIAALHHMAKMRRRVEDYEKIKSDQENLVLGGLNDVQRQGPLVTMDDPVALRLEATRRAQRRGSLDDVYLRSRTPKEFEIELKLDHPISLEFSQTPLDQAIENIRTMTNLPFSWDTAALEAEGISTVKPISEKLPGVSTRNALHLILDKVGLAFVIEYETVRITTVKKAKGKLFTKVFSVADLVTPVPNFALPDYANFEKMINRNALSSNNVQIQGLTPGLGGATPHLPASGLGGGLPAAQGPVGSMPAGIAGGAPFSEQGGTLQSTLGAGNGPNPLSSSAHLAPDRNTKHEQLIRLITSMVKPYSWDGMGGAGKVEYFDLGSALVVNQTADVIREVADLLEALRRLQDLAIAIEVRIISLSETWFERMGVDFAMNIKTNTTKFEPALTTNQFRPEPFINDNNFKGVTVGMTPAGTFTPDLDVPIRATSYQYAIPGFGGYPNTPGFNGGVSLGLAFLNDIQVFMFMEAAQGDRRVNVMQAPKLTLFNGQTATITINDLQFFVTNVTVVSVNGQIVFIPTNSPFPGPGAFTAGGISLALQGVVSADRRFVRINLPVTLSAQTGATVPLFPITTFVTPVFEGGSQGVPIPFTQFLQQPAFTTMTIATTVVCPDGGTVLLGGLKTLQEGRNEFGPPFLSKIPYINRLFKNVGIGRETTHIMIMVTPRIIINAEEEINQTEGRGAFGTGPGQ